MGVKLRKIEIFNFRSIKSISIKVSELSVFVGTNDAGKSNILRALNLFFNDETNPNEELAFLIDHNVHNDPNQRAKEIRVRLEFDIPDAYKKTNGEYIIWEKKWRKIAQTIPREKKIREIYFRKLCSGKFIYNKRL